MAITANEGVRNDYEQFRHFLSPSGHVVFHDICVGPDRWPGATTLRGQTPDVKRFWAQVRQRRSVEIIDLIAPEPTFTQPRTVLGHRHFFKSLPSSDRHLRQDILTVGTKATLTACGGQLPDLEPQHLLEAP